jgi:protein-disulfide isomerase
MRIKDVVSNLALAIAAISALTMAGLAVRDELRPRGSVAGSLARTDPVPFDRWNDVVAQGRRVGPAGAPVTIVEFGDFECPACSGFQELTLKPIMKAHKGEVALIYHHLPLPFHRFAYPAARAAECAGAQDRFQAYHELLFERHDSLGLKSFHDFAKSAGVPDLEAFDRCNSVQSKVATVEADIALAHKVGFRATPTVLINGALWPIAPDSGALEREITKIISKANVKGSR